VQVRIRAAGTEWGPWRTIGEPTAKCYRVVPMMREGWQVQAQVAVAPPAPVPPAPAAVPAWENATEVTFDRSRATFTFLLAPQRKALTLPAGAIVSAVVDQFGCSYRLAAELDLEPGIAATVSMDAVHLSGWCQLDYPGHFTSKSIPGVTVTNAMPSANDLIPTSNPAAAFTVLSKQAHPGGPGIVVKTGRNWLLPTG
jgi:hypothetical protein